MVAVKTLATQVTLERLSNMGLILSSWSFSVKEDIIQGILIQRCYKIFYRDGKGAAESHN
jgi:hypothetical protein